VHEVYKKGGKSMFKKKKLPCLPGILFYYMPDGSHYWLWKGDKWVLNVPNPSEAEIKAIIDIHKEILRVANGLIASRG
jgi:hypothetical protein